MNTQLWKTGKTARSRLIAIEEEEDDDEELCLMPMT